MSKTPYLISRISTISLLAVANALLVYLVWVALGNSMAGYMIPGLALIVAPATIALVGVLGNARWGTGLAGGVALFWLGVGAMELLTGFRPNWDEIAITTGGGLLLISVIAMAVTRARLRNSTNEVKGGWRLGLPQTVVAFNVVLLPVAYIVIGDNLRLASGTPLWLQIGFFALLTIVTAGAVLLAMGKTAGLLLLLVGDAAVLGVYLLTVRYGARADEVSFLIPAVLVSCVAMGAFAKPMWRFLRR